jgi:hypothetical protein
MASLKNSATVASTVGQATRVLSSVSQTSAGIYNGISNISSAAVRTSAVNGLTNVGTGVVNALPGVASGVGSAAGAVAALGAVTGSRGLMNAAGAVAGVAGAVAGVASAVGAISNAVGAISNLFGGSAGGGSGGGGGAGSGSNPLHAYASFNYLFGLYALTDGEVNGGTRGGGIPIIQEPSGPTVGATTFIDNVRISGVVGLDKQAGNSNALSIAFKVTEPYSMGKFWETLQAGALAAGHANYAAAPYMLKIEFKGHFSPDQPFQTIPNTNKYIHMKIRDVQMRVTAKGAEYDIEAYPWNEGGMSSSFAEIKTDAAICCNEKGPYKVKDLLKDAVKSLKATINSKLKDDKDRKKTVTYAHEIDIVFPPAPYTSNSDGNIIGESELGLSQYNRADSPFAKDGATYDPATGIYSRGAIQINTKNGDFKFAQGSTVQDIINQVVLSSEYGRKALEEANQTANGKVVWWRIETHLHNISGSEDPKTGDKAKKIIFRVVPYEVDASIFLPPNTKGKAQASQSYAREFNYLYTGKNYDILDWNIEYKIGFYRAFNADGGANSEDKTLAIRSSNAGPTISGGSPPEPEPAGGSGPERVQRDKNGTKTAKFGGARFDDAATTAARQFHDLATAGEDMINLQLTVLGDPYFLGDSGHGNFTIPGSGPINSEGSMNWQEGQVFVKVTFRMPEDVNTDTGFYDFGGIGKPVREFSGLYKVQDVESTFIRGKFTQKLGMFKVPGGLAETSGNYPPKEPQPDSPSIYYP